MITWLRNKLYDWGTLSAIEFDIPTIAVGNLSVGGTGKTPHVEYLIQLLRQHYKVATLSRGYNRKTQGYRIADEASSASEIGDEPMQFHLKFPDIAIGVGEQRALALPQLLMDAPDTQVILLDDAFQHRSILPGYNILVTEYANLFTRDHIVPFGRLRESRAGYKRAACIIVSKCPQEMTLDEKDEITREIELQPHQQLFFTTLHYGTLYDFATREVITVTDTVSVLMVCGIARPEPMLHYLESRFKTVDMLKFPDHHYFTPEDIEQINDAWRETEHVRKIIVTTEKDAVRLQLLRDEINKFNLPISVLPLEVRFLFDAADSFNNHIFEYMAQALLAQENNYNEE